RDATFEGRPAYPTTDAPWIGYTVVQAKYKERPTGDSKDADWLVAQLKAEQTKFAKRSKSYRRPDYYVIVTNVALSAVPRTTNKKAKTIKLKSPAF
ncbi:hypothetical protein, partial [Pseudomonas sp.]|uniref:hypothetical protein n=1 Tax=Pseudomonas sp. TaxID=306 RepID=UPI002E2EF49D